MNVEQAPVAIVGGGFAGLTAAQALKDAGIPFDLYEAGSQIAGLAATFKDDDGFSYDFGMHVITNRLATTLGVQDECRDVGYFGETVRIGGREYAYPFGLLRVPHYVTSAMRSRLRAKPDAGDESAEGWLRGSLGDALAEDIAIPLLEALTGHDAKEVASSVSSKLPSVARTVYLRLAGRLNGKAVAIGYSRDLPETPKVWHTYPVGGIGMLCSRLAAGLDDHIRLESRVEKILVESGRTVGLQVNGEQKPASAVVSTAPVNILPKLVEGSDAVDRLADFEYSPVAFVNLRFEGRGLLPDVVLWTPEKQFPYFRLQEVPQSMPWTAPEGKTLVTADIGCKVGDEYWEMEDEALGELCVQTLKPIIHDAQERYLGCRVLRTRIAYPVLLKRYEDTRQRLAASTGIEGLYSVGRNGEFDHILMEDVYHRTRKKMEQLIARLRGS